MAKAYMVSIARFVHRHALALMDAVSTKRPSSIESNLDGETIKCSDSFQQEDNAKCAKLASLSDTTLQDLPIELLEDILIKAVLMEVIDMKMAKNVWKKKADLVMSRLGTVCAHWNNILESNFIRNKVHGILDGIVKSPWLLAILHQCHLEICALSLTVLKDEVFVVWGDCVHGYSINVYNRLNSFSMSDVIPLLNRKALAIAACRMSNCVYLLNTTEEFQGSVLRITKDDYLQFNMSAMISDILQPYPTLSVTTTGELILSRKQRESGVAIDIYNADGISQYEVKLSSEFTSLKQIIPKENGNIVLVSLVNYETKLTEVDRSGTILREYLHSGLGSGSMSVCQADNDGRLLMTSGLSNEGMLLDSEFNFMARTGPWPGKYYSFSSCHVHCNSVKNEVFCLSGVAAVRSGVLTFFAFLEPLESWPAL